MSAFIDLQNKIRNSPYLPSAEKMEMLSLLGEVSEENVKTINELTDSTCRSVTSAVVSMLAEKPEKGEKKMKIPTIKEVVDIIDRVLVPQMEMHIKSAKDENNEMKEQSFDKFGYMYNRGKIDATSNDMEIFKNISSLLKETEK